MSKLTNQISLFNDHRRQWGLRRAAYWSMMNLLERLIGLRLHYVIYSSGIRDVVRRPAPERPLGYETRLVRPEVLLSYADVVPSLDVDAVKAASTHGDLCAANFYNGEPVGWLFHARTRTTVTDQLDAIVPDGFRYSYYSWTHPDHRQKHLADMRSHALREARRGSELTRAISFIETHNYPSLLRGYRGPQERGIGMGYVGWVRLAGREFPFNSRKAKWIGFEFVRKDDRRVRQYSSV